MPKTSMTNMHLPLPEPIYTRLRAEARRSGRPATDLAREAIDRWLAELHRMEVHEAIAAYAADAAGSVHDLDGDLEGAAVDHLLTHADGEARTL